MCSKDEDASNSYVGEWMVTYGSFYGESAYLITFVDNELYNRRIVDIPGFGTFNDNGTYLISGDKLIFKPIGGITNSNVYNVFTIVKYPENRTMTMGIHAGSRDIDVEFRRK